MAERIKFYTDEQVGRAVIEGVRRRGAAVLTVPEAGMRGASDEEHLAFAYQNQWVLFTQDDDFLRLHAAGHVHAGIAYAHQQRLSIGEIIRGLMLIYDMLRPEEMMGHVEYL